jgi:pre-mRNA-splicing factor CDC5/CEF1
MLSEARARLANTSGKKAKRKARERQLEESKRLAHLQKRRELKAAGINIKIQPKKGNHIDYNADIPLEKQVPAGFFDTTEELRQNEREREAFDPRKRQLANKRKAADRDEGGDNKRKKNDQNADGSAASFAKAAREQKIREAEQSSKRRALVLPSPQVGEAELDIVVKDRMAEQKALANGESTGFGMRDFVGRNPQLLTETPIRTPQAPKEEDVILNEARNARLRTETQSALLGGDNPELEEVAPAALPGAGPRQPIVTPNPLLTPFRQANGAGGATPVRRGSGATPMRTPGGMQLAGLTPRDARLQEKAKRQDRLSTLRALPKAGEQSWEFELPEEQAETQEVEVSEEDAAERDRRERVAREAAERAEFARQTQVIQKGLPRPSLFDLDAALKRASEMDDPVQREVEQEMALLIANDIAKFGGGKVLGNLRPLEKFRDEALNRAKMELALELATSSDKAKKKFFSGLNNAWTNLHGSSKLPGLDGYEEDEVDEHQLMVEEFDKVTQETVEKAQQANKIEKKLAVHHGGYIKRSQLLQQKIVDAAKALEQARIDESTSRTMLYSEQTAISRRLETLRNEVGIVSRKEREAQELYRARKDELDGLQIPVNGDY